MAKQIDELKALIGERAVIDDPALMSPYLNEPRKRFHVPAAAVVRPSSVEQVQAVARWANDRRRKKKEREKRRAAEAAPPSASRR